MAEFWDDQYKDELREPFDWFFGYYDKSFEWWDAILLNSAQISDVLSFDDKDEQCRKDHDQRFPEVLHNKRSTIHILMIGCGHSALSYDLFENGYTQIVSVDSSKEVIDAMKLKHPQMVWLTGDARDLKETLPTPHGNDSSYDVIIDKGLLDALLVYPGCGQAAGQEAVSEMQRLLKPSGKLFVISCLREATGESSGGSDGFGGGDAKCYRSLYNDLIEWECIDYQEMKNPRGLSGLPPSTSPIGSIAPQFADICPTQYAIIQAVMKKSEKASFIEERIVAEVEDRYIKDRNNRKVDDVEPVVAVNTTLSSSPPSSAAIATTLKSEASIEFDRSEPSMVDYDDYYKGSFLSTSGSDADSIEVEGHDAFLSSDALLSLMHLERLKYHSDTSNINRSNDHDKPALDESGETAAAVHPEDSTTDTSNWLFGRGAFVLEVGCGSSAVGIGLHKLGYDYLGTDAIPSAIQSQQKRYPELKLCVADARSLRRDLKCNLNKPVDIIFDKGTADALLLFEKPDAALSQYLKEAHELLTSRCFSQTGVYKDEHDNSVDKEEMMNKEAGVFLVVTCLRMKGGILNGSGSPRIFHHMNLVQNDSPLKQQGSGLSDCQKAGKEYTWRVLKHDRIESDVKAAGDNDRTYDVLLFQPLMN